LDESETVKGLVSASVIEGFVLKNKILYILNRSTECVKETNWKEIEKVEAESLGTGVHGEDQDMMKGFGLYR
jgi:hypothetical protein